MTRYAFLDHDGPIAFAHRGGAAGGYENSMRAFARAVGLGYRYLETDVHATSDDVLLAFHDHRLDRVTDAVGRIAELAWSQVRHARIGGSEPIPLLEDVLGTWPDIRVNIDVKHPSAVAPLAAAIRRTGAIDRVCVAAFSQRRIAAVRRELGPRLCTALGPREVARLRIAASAPRITGLLGPGAGRPPPAPCVQVPDSLRRLRVVTPGLLDLAHRRGQHVHVWTIDDAAEMGRLLDLGVDGLMTDQLETLRDAMRARGQWPA